MVDAEHFTKATLNYALKRAKIGEGGVTLLECPVCDGDGELVGSHRSTCSACVGRGRMSYSLFQLAVQKADKWRHREALKRQVSDNLYKLTDAQLAAIIETIKSMPEEA